jgi:nucleotide-binding universal stress UspA family protein
MKNILVPVGTSKNTLSHLQYAVDFAEAFGAKLYVVQVYKVFSKAGTMINLDHIVERESKEYLDDLISNINTKNVEVVAKALKGKIVDTVELVCKIANIDLILIQPRTNSVKDEVFLGATSGKIIKQLNGPASLIVPEGSIFEPTKKILMAMKSAIIKKENVLDPLASIKEKFKSKIDLLLVKTPFHNEGDFDVNDELKSLVDDISSTENATTFQGYYFIMNLIVQICYVLLDEKRIFYEEMEKNIILKKDFSSTIPVLVLSGLK